VGGIDMIIYRGIDRTVPGTTAGPAGGRIAAGSGHLNIPTAPRSARTGGIDGPQQGRIAEVVRG
jgi:hypothetical protein